MAVYNGERFIQEQLNSLLRQTRLPDELVVSDNSSTDGTLEIVYKFAVRAPFSVRIFVNERNLGVSKNFERAIRECTGDIIFLSDSDDVWYADKIKRMESEFTEAPGAGLVICDAELVARDLAPLGRCLWQTMNYRASTLTRELPDVSRYSFPHYGNCMAFRSGLKRMILPLPEGSIYMHGYHDGFIALVVVCSGSELKVVPSPLLAYRQHRRQLFGCAQSTALARWRSSWSSRTSRSSLSELMEAVIARVERFKPGATSRVPVLIHWQARRNLPEKCLARLPVVARELLTLRYRHYSNGAMTAVRDLLFVR